MSLVTYLFSLYTYSCSYNQHVIVMKYKEVIKWLFVKCFNVSG